MAFARPYHAGAETAPLRENLPQHPLRPFPARPSRLGLAPPGRGGLRTPAREGIGLTKAWPRQVTGRSFAPDDHVMPRLAYGLAMRARRPRPSEKIALRVVSGFSPQGHPCRASPPRRGGLRTPTGETLPPPGDRAIRPPGVRLLPMIMLCLGIGEASQRGRTECVPPRKPPSASSPGFPRKAIRAGLASRGGAGSARPDMRLRLDRSMGPLGHRLIVNPSGGNGMPWFASGPYLRTRRARPLYV